MLGAEEKKHQSTVVARKLTLASRNFLLAVLHVVPAYVRKFDAHDRRERVPALDQHDDMRRSCRYCLNPVIFRLSFETTPNSILDRTFKRSSIWNKIALTFAGLKVRRYNSRCKALNGLCQQGNIV